MTITYTLYLLSACWKDLRYRKIPVWLFGLFGCLGIVKVCFWPETGWLEMLPAFFPGIFLLCLTKCSRGAVGAGDGLFFLVSAFYLDFWNTLGLLLYGLVFCSACCLGIIAWGVISGTNVRKMRLPFLPFLLPAWLWMWL